MALGLFASFAGAFFGWSMALLSLFLILLVLVQRGRGGGLTGALGGPGGQSAFGSKAGDMFTRITFVTAGIWIFLCAAAMWTLGNARSVTSQPPQSTVSESPATRQGDDAVLPAEGLGDIEELLRQAGEETGGEAAPETREAATGEAGPAVEEIPAEEAPLEAEATDDDAPEAATSN